jgi:DNA-binding transcriptional MerR regulator
MPVQVNGQTYYRTAEVYRMVGISRTTLFRWLKEDILREAQHRDRRGWRLFTEDEIDILKTEANRISKTDQFKMERALQLSRHLS